jgi:hypothetical protein
MTARLEFLLLDVTSPPPPSSHPAGLTIADLTDPSWVKDGAKADKIAAAVLEWAVSLGANSFCHWFQPMVRSPLLAPS